MVLEEIVKKNVPFAGIFGMSGFNNRDRVQIPITLFEILKERQTQTDPKDIILYYRINDEGALPHIELTDYFPNGQPADFKHYTYTKLDKHRRLLLNKQDRQKFESGQSKKVVFVGDGNRILIYASEIYSQIDPRQVGFRYSPRGQSSMTH